ncbi:MAG TPA: ATP-binding protein [Candidatus Dormibacteraeota bacterium]|nr:ATP-binding protein [Candidatus Dormibacteraeota bacterium]
MAPDQGQWLVWIPSRGLGLVRRLTPYAAWIFVALYALAALFAGLARSERAAEVATAVLLAALGVVGVAAIEIVRRSRVTARAAAAETAGLRKQEEVARLMLGGATVGLGLIDADARWVEVNDALCALLGRSPGEMRSTTLLAVTESGAASGLGPALDELRAGSRVSWTGETVQVRGSGETVPVAVAIARTARDGAEPLFLVQVTDISQAKRAVNLGDVLVAVRHAVATSAGWEQAAPHVLSAVGLNLNRDAVQFWAVDSDRDALHLRYSWHRDDPAFEEFDHACRELWVPPGQGVLGRVRQSGVAAATSNITPISEPSLTLPARKASLATLVAGPVVASGDVIGVIALLARASLKEEDDVITMLTTAGSEIGQFIQRDETLQALRRSEADHRAIFERAPIGIVRVSASGELIEGNDALLKMLELDIATLRDQAWPDLMRSYDLAAGKSRVAPLLAGFSDGGSVQVRAATGGGRWLWLQMTATSIPDANGKPEHVLVMVEDVTRVRDTQDKLGDALEAQRSANADLEKLDRTKTEFLSIVSHEFRTALTGIQGFSELIRDGGLEPDELRAYGGYIFNDADRVNRLIGDMLDLDRMESGRMTIRMADVDVNEVLSEAIARAASSSTVEFKPDLDPRLPIVTGDRDRLVQVVSNLVSNAVKYSPEGGTVTLSSRAEGGYALVTVADTGLGIPPDEIAHVFERFRRVRSGAAQSIAGTGLGLTIVKQIVEMHGGKIWVESAVGHGSAFHFTIPLAPEAVTPATQLRRA